VLGVDVNDITEVHGEWSNLAGTSTELCDGNTVLGPVLECITWSAWTVLEVVSVGFSFLVDSISNCLAVSGYLPAVTGVIDVTGDW